MTFRLVRVLLIFSGYLLVCGLGYLGYTSSPQNLIGWFLLLIAIAYGLGGPYLLISHLKSERLERQEGQDRSFWLLIPGFLAAFYASPLEYLLQHETLPRLIIMQIIGLVLILTSLFLITWARIALYSMYSGKLRIKKDHVLIQDGPYRTIRHPAYAGFLLMCLGIAIGYSSLIGLLAIVSLLIPAFIYRIRVEEGLLSSAFPELYPQYMKNTKKLLPGIW